MTQAYFPARVLAQEYMPDSVQHRRQIAQILNTTMQGRLGCTFTVTLDANEDTTTVIDSRISFMTAPLVSPMTLHAAEEIGNGTMWFEPTGGECVIHHANNAQTDRTFTMAIVG